jgi:GTP cyclohydrolase I
MSKKKFAEEFDIKLPFTSYLAPHEIRDISFEMKPTLDKLMPGWDECPSTEETHRRFAKYLAEFRQPIPISSIFKVFDKPNGHDSMVIQTNIPFRMCCEHHLLPAVGTASLGYIPNERVIGLSKLCRLVDAVGVESPSLQEKIADRIVDLLARHLKPKGIMLVIKSEHSCMSCRGVTKPNVPTITSSIHGIFRDVTSARQEMLALINGD